MTRDLTKTDQKGSAIFPESAPVLFMDVSGVAVQLHSIEQGMNSIPGLGQSGADPRGKKQKKPKTNKTQQALLF